MPVVTNEKLAPFPFLLYMIFALQRASCRVPNSRSVGFRCVTRNTGRIRLKEIN